MLKKAFTVLLCAVFLFSVYMFNSAPIFGCSDKIEIYFSHSSSNAVIKTVDKSEYAYLTGVKGESVRFGADGFDLGKFLKRYGAQVVITECAGGVTCYYAYSPEIRYRETVKGKQVNLQVAVRGDTVTVGSPIIYGSF